MLCGVGRVREFVTCASVSFYGEIVWVKKRDANTASSSSSPHHHITPHFVDKAYSYLTRPAKKSHDCDNADAVCKTYELFSHRFKKRENSAVFFFKMNTKKCQACHPYLLFTKRCAFRLVFIFTMKSRLCLPMHYYRSSFEEGMRVF